MVVMTVRTYKIRNGDIEVDSFEANCWYNGQRVFADKIRKGLEGYVYMVDREDVEGYGFEWKGPGYYGEGDTLLNDQLIDTFFDGKKTLTIKVKK